MEAHTTTTGYLIIAHGPLGNEMLNALEFIAGKQPTFRAIAIDHGLDVERARQIVEDAVNSTMGSEGVIIFTDLFGGAPSNIALSLMDDKPIEIIAGVNMPILLYTAALDADLPLKQKAEKLRDYGKNNIFLASEVLSGQSPKA